MKVILKRDEFNELNKEYEVHHIEQDKYGNKKIYLSKHRWVAPSLVEKYIEGENMKTTIYDLLGMIKDGKAPKKIMYKNRQYELNDNNEYHCQDKDLGLFEYLFSMYYTDEVLNAEVEILETTITMKDDKFTGVKYYSDGIEIGSMDYSIHYSTEELAEEDDKIEKIKNLNTDYYTKKLNSENLSKEEIILDIQTLKHKINEIIDYIQKE